MKKIKIFLGAYVNFPNAQNVNCDNIARYLDKDKFEVHVMYTSKMPIDKKKYKEMGIILHRLWHHRIVWKWSKLWGMRKANCDIYYLPKLEEVDTKFAKNGGKGKVCISSAEGVVGGSLPTVGETKICLMEYMDEFFSISQDIQKSVKKYWNYDSKVLYLGVREMQEQPSQKTNIKRIVWAGNIKANKRPMYLVECAKNFPDLQFTMIGDGDMQKDVEKFIAENNLNNVTMTGRVPNEKVYEYMRQGDLLLMTSEFEGLPKVIQEAAQCGLPSIYINENYNVDFIENGINGYGVSSLEEMQEKLQYLLDNPKKYQEISEQAFTIIQNYTWEKLIKEYETYFEEVLHKYSKNKE